MVSLAGFAFGAVAGLGVLLVVLGFRGVEPRLEVRASLAQQLRGRVDRLNVRLGLACVAAGGAWLATGWPVGALLAGAGGWASPSLAGAKARRKAELGRLEALAVWAEQLRDTIGAAAGLQEAILATAKVAPLPIRAEVAELATRLRREPLSVALRRFAGSLADPAADQIVAALALASERQAGNLVGLLSEVASAARQQVSMRLRIETGRARTYTQTMSVALITGGSVGLLVVMRSSYLDPYDTAAGQMVLAGVGLLFVVAAVSVVRLSRVERPNRHLGGVAAEAAT